jgi:hypothetical protein
MRAVFKFFCFAFVALKHPRRVNALAENCFSLYRLTPVLG